jgi:hypothetical protein
MSYAKMGEPNKRTKLKATTLDAAKKEALKAVGTPEKGKSLSIWLTEKPERGAFALSTYKQGKWNDTPADLAAIRY